MKTLSGAGVDAALSRACRRIARLRAGEAVAVALAMGALAAVAGRAFIGLPTAAAGAVVALAAAKIALRGRKPTLAQVARSLDEIRGSGGLFAAAVEIRPEESPVAALCRARAEARLAQEGIRGLVRPRGAVLAGALACGAAALVLELTSAGVAPARADGPEATVAAVGRSARTLASLGVGGAEAVAEAAARLAAAPPKPESARALVEEARSLGRRATKAGDAAVFEEGVRLGHLADRLAATARPRVPGSGEGPVGRTGPAAEVPAAGPGAASVLSPVVESAGGEPAPARPPFVPPRFQEVVARYFARTGSRP